MSIPGGLAEVNWNGHYTNQQESKHSESSVARLSVELRKFTGFEGVHCTHQCDENQVDHDNEHCGFKGMSTLRAVSYTHLTLPTIYSV